MKNILSALGATLLLTSCAGVKVIDTQVASGATNPSAIYIRPFDVRATEWSGQHAGGPGEQPIRQSLAGQQFAQDLKQQFEKMAPTAVLEPGDKAPTGWLVEGSLEVVNAGKPYQRAFPIVNHFGTGASKVVIHVRISDASGRSVASSDKDASKLRQRGRVLYEFDLAGGSEGTGQLGSITAPGLGYSVPFDFKNAAERAVQALEIDPHRYGARESTAIR